MIHIFEDDWFSNPDVVRSLILAKLGLISDRIFARKTLIKPIPARECSQFLEKHHLQGHVPASIQLGMFYDRELVAVLTLGKPRYNKNIDLEIYRWCIRAHTSVVGGFSKMLRAAENLAHPRSIISYCDLAKSAGNLYLANGFSLVRTLPPDYWYWCAREPWRHHRSSFMKHKLARMLPVFDPHLSEVENMVNNKWNRIFDCGSAVFVKYCIN